MSQKRAYRILPPGESWVRFSLAFSPRDFKDMEMLRAGKSKVEYFTYLFNAHRAHTFEFKAKKDRAEVEQEISTQSSQEKITVDTF